MADISKNDMENDTNTQTDKEEIPDEFRNLMNDFMGTY